MTRKEIEQGIIDSFTQMLKDDGVVLTDKKFSGADHFGDYSFFVNGLKYEFSIVFIKPNFLKVVSSLHISHPEITKLFNTIATDDQTGEFTIASVNINSLMVIKNSRGIHKSPDEADLYIDEKPIETQNDIETITKKVLYDKLYKFIREVVVPKTNSLEKIDYLLNDLPLANTTADKPDWSMYASFIPEQVLNGALLAIYHARSDKQVLFDKYLAYASKFEKGQKLSIDIMRMAIEQYRNAPVNADYIPFKEDSNTPGLLDKLGRFFKKKS